MEVQNLLFKAQMSQMAQVIDEMNEQAFIRNRITKLNDAYEYEKEQYHEQISYLLGIVRGQIPAMVPWQRSKDPLPLTDVINAIMEHTYRRPTRRGTDTRYYPFIMVPRLLAPGEKGYFSCKWNMGPVTPLCAAPFQMKALDIILNSCVPQIFPSQNTKGLFMPFLTSERCSISAPVRRRCVSLDVSDFIPPNVATPDDNGKKNLKLVFREEGFLNSGFVITRPTWL